MKRLLTLLSVILTSAVSLFAQGDPVQITPYLAIDTRTGQAIACAGCLMYTYAAGTSTPLATYTGPTLTVTNTNPVVMNSAGYATDGSSITGIWVGSACYKFILKDASNVIIWTQDHVCDHAAVQALSLYGLDIVQNPTPPAYGSYIDLKPITYNPYNGSPCTDIYGNPVQQPLPSPVLTSFGANDLLIWNGTSPVMPADNSCGVPLPINTVYGINTNGYMYARAGFATDIAAFNSIQSLEGGMWAKTFTAIDYVMTGNYSAALATGPPNPWGGWGTGAVSYSTTAACEAMYTGAAWVCLASRVSGTGTALIGIIQINDTGATATGIEILESASRIANWNATPAASFEVVNNAGTNDFIVLQGASVKIPHVGAGSAGNAACFDGSNLVYKSAGVDCT